MPDGAWGVRARYAGGGRIGPVYWGGAWLKSLWIHDEGVSLGWLGFGRHGRVFARWAELDRPWVSQSRIGWGAGPMDSYVFSPFPRGWPAVSDMWRSRRPDAEFWCASRPSQLYWPRMFSAPPVCDVVARARPPAGSCQIK